MPSLTWSERRQDSLNMVLQHPLMLLGCLAAFTLLATSSSLKQLARLVLVEADPAGSKAQGQEWRKLLTESSDGPELPGWASGARTPAATPAAGDSHLF